MTGPHALHAFERDLEPAMALAHCLGIPLRPIALHRFPDGESLVRVGESGMTPILYCRLDHPNDRLVELLLAADALTPGDSARPVLVAPYLPYMRQDIAFHPGEAVSQRVIARLLGAGFSTIVTVEPHLHRTPSLEPLLARSRAITLPAAPALAPLVRAERGAPPLLVGPDGESTPLVALLAELSGRECLHFTKRRSGDRAVALAVPPELPVSGRRILLVDDICSTGTTLAEAAALLKRAGAGPIEALVVHALYDAEAASRMRAAGIDRVRSTNSVAHDSNAIDLAPSLAAALQEYAR